MFGVKFNYWEKIKIFKRAQKTLIEKKFHFDRFYKKKLHILFNYPKDQHIQKSAFYVKKHDHSGHFSIQKIGKILSKKIKKNFF